MRTRRLGATLITGWALFLATAVTTGCEGQTPEADEQGQVGGTAIDLPTGNSLRDVLLIDDPYERTAALATLLPTLGSESVPDARAALQDYGLSLSASDFDLMIRFWASHDPAAAVHWVYKRSWPRHRLSATRTAIEIYAERDPAGAVAAVDAALREADEAVARVAQVALVHGWFQRDREGLLEYIEGMGPGLNRQRAVFAYAIALAEADGSDALMKWAQSVPSENKRFKLTVYRQVTAALGFADMKSALRWCELECDGDFGDAMRNVIIRTRLRNGDPGQEIVEWVVRTAPDETEEQLEERNHSIWVAFTTWAFENRPEAMVWLDAHVKQEDPEPWVRSLYGEYARQLAKDAPAEAIRWGERVEDPKERNLTLVRIARYWRTQDEAAAEAWLAESPLSEKDREDARKKGPFFLPGLL